MKIHCKATFLLPDGSHDKVRAAGIGYSVQTAATEDTTGLYTENLALKSNHRIETVNYGIGNYDLAEELSFNTDYTVTVWGELGAGKSEFGVYTGGGYQPFVYLKKIGAGVYSGVLSIGTAIGGDGRRDRIQLYARPNTVTGVVSTVERLKLEKGINGNPSWTPAAREMLGEDAVTYEVEPSVLVVGLGERGVLSPPVVTFNCWKRTGAEAKRSAYAGRLVIDESRDGVNYVNRYTSAADESSRAYTLSDGNVRFVRCSLYAAGGVTSLLDVKPVTVVPEAGMLLDRLNDDGVFEVWEKRAMRAEWWTISGSRTTSSPGSGLYRDAVSKFGQEVVDGMSVTAYYESLGAYLENFALWDNVDTRVGANGATFSKLQLAKLLDLFYRGLQQLTYSLTDSFEYLSGAFKDISTQESPGVVLTGFSGVKNTADAVVAGMAGKNFLTGADYVPDDETCPVFFAGAKSLLQANEAKTRIYPSGRLETSYLKATGGEFGNMRIDDGAIVMSHNKDDAPGKGHGCTIQDGIFLSWCGNNVMDLAAGGRIDDGLMRTVYFHTQLYNTRDIIEHRAFEVLMSIVGRPLLAGV